ncbi:Predicted acyl-CoA dehydrogenase [gamma proteobacterium HdN1]|nr:Predicted acyl-CoA dehydrogenase [gamma proteobacterium HdN1]
MDSVFKRARQFSREIAAPMALHIEREIRRAPTNKEPVWEFVRAAGKAGLLSLTIPKKFGGGGYSWATCVILFEELCSVCTGLGNIIGGHYLGMFVMRNTFSLARTAEVFREIVANETSIKPVLLASAMTEPSVGSDHTEVGLWESARPQSEARPVEGGYILNGRKQFISCGRLSTYHLVFMSTDRKNYMDSMATFLMRSDAKGFSFGRDEKKMGQLATPATEMIYEDCFVDESNRLTPYFGPIAKKTTDFMGFTRLLIGAMATGAARGAYERALTFARDTTVRGEVLVNHQWAQMVLGDMYMNVLISRAAVQEGFFSDVNHGMNKMFLPAKRNGYRRKQIIDGVLTAGASQFGSDLLQQRKMRHSVGKAIGWVMDHAGLNTPIMNTFTSTAKAKCSDLAMMNANLGIDLMGSFGLRQDEGMEKILRDIKLLQIYEGTNEICTFGVFQRIVADHDFGIRMWSKSQ